MRTQNDGNFSLSSFNRHAIVDHKKPLGKSDEGYYKLKHLPGVKWIWQCLDTEELSNCTVVMAVVQSLSIVWLALSLVSLSLPEGIAAGDRKKVVVGNELFS